MEFVLLGWPDAGPTLRLDHRRFSYAGKFVMSTTGKAAVRADAPRPGDRIGDGAARSAAADGNRRGAAPDDRGFDEYVLAAAAFNEDRTESGVLWIRYLTVARERRGEGLGARLAAFVAARAERRGYARLRIAVNNPFAYQALYKAGFGYTGRETGLAELVLERPGPRDRPTYQAGLDVFRDRADGEPEAPFLARLEGADPPEVVAVPVTDSGA